MSIMHGQIPTNVPINREHLNLVNERGGLLEDARKIADGNPGPAEERKMKDMLKRVDEIDRELQVRGLPKHLVSQEEALRASGIAGELEAEGRGTFSPGAGEVRALRPGQKMADLYRGSIEPDQRDLSMGRFVRGIVTGEWDGAEAERRALVEGSGLAGGYLVPDVLSLNVIDLARNQARVIQAGALTVPMESPELKMARILTDPTAYWRGERQTITESEMSFGEVTLHAQTLAAFVKCSVELVEDASNISSVIEGAMASALALELDRAALLGNGVGRPLGINEWDDVQRIDLGENGAAISDYSYFSQAWRMVQEANGPSEGLACIMSPRDAGLIDNLQDTTNQPLRPPASYESMKKLITNQVPANLTKGTAEAASLVFVGDFSQLLVGIRTNLVIESARFASDSDSSAFKNLEVWMRAYMRADTVLARPPWFCIVDGITG